MKTKISFADGIAVFAVLLCAVLLFVFPLLTEEKGEIVVISTPEGFYEYSLQEDQTLTLTSRGITLTVVIQGGEAFVSSSDCPDHVCVTSGRISKSGETVVCAPAGVSVTVKGGARDVDFVAG
ncbi:MAG: NusG domain II-containing protein [Clostridia bacterium]|nr:NusG domain II-containing protein [Clostridia bacterium]